MEQTNMPANTEKKSWNPFHPLRRLYNWVLHWADTPYAVPALFILAFAESSFFPIPPDVLLIALAISIPTRAFYYALICSVGSVIGGGFGYLIGWKFYDLIGVPIINFYQGWEVFNKIEGMYDEHGLLAVLIAAFTPIPYKIFTIASGVFWRDDLSNFASFMGASLFGRSARFFLVAGFIWYFGPTIKTFVEKYFELLTVAFTVALILGFVAVKYLF